MQNIFPIYSAAQELAGLKLKPIKCVIVPLVDFTDEVVNAIRNWIEINIPDWVTFKIAPYAKLLGFFMDLAWGNAIGPNPWTSLFTESKTFKGPRPPSL